MWRISCLLSSGEWENGFGSHTSGRPEYSVGRSFLAAVGSFARVAELIVDGCKVPVGKTLTMGCVLGSEGFCMPHAGGRGEEDQH